MKKTTPQAGTTSAKKKSSPAKKIEKIQAPTAVTQKPAAPKKATAKVSTPVKKNPVKTVATSEKVSSKKSSAPLVSKKEQAKKTVAKGVTSTKKVIKEKIVPEIKKIDMPKITSTPKESIKMLGILHLAGNILSGGTLGIILILGYLLIKKDTLTTIEKETCYEIINFNLSFIIYAFIAGVSMMILIGFVLLPIVIVTWLLLLILGFLGHLNGENYQYPFIIRFIK